MRKRIKAIAAILLLIGLSACNLPGSNGSGRSRESIINTAAAQTVAALATRGPSSPTPAAEGTPAVTETPGAANRTQTPTPAGGPTQAATNTPDAACNQAQFVADLTVPDGMKVMPNARFVKTWALKNTGTCAWTPGYTVVFAGRGTAMTSQPSFPLIQEGEVKPGETANVRIMLAAPGELGIYRGYWMLRSPDDKDFGIGDNGATPFFVEIEVAEGDLYAFVEHLCEADWKTGAGPLPCPGQETDSRGYVVSIENPTMEDNSTHEGFGLITMAEPVPGGYIAGQYPPVVIPQDADFRATISCKPGATACYVRFKVTYRIDNGEEQVLGEWNEGYESQTNFAVKDLDHLTGRLVSFTLYLSVNGPPEQSTGIWLDPRITK